MGRLIKSPASTSDTDPITLNLLLMPCSIIFLVGALATWEAQDIRLSRACSGASIVTSLIVDRLNQSSKNSVAIAQMVSDAESRLAARLVDAQEKSQSADLSVASHQKLSQLNLQKTFIDADLEAEIIALEQRRSELYARLEEFQTEE